MYDSKTWSDIHTLLPRACTSMTMNISSQKQRKIHNVLSPGKKMFNRLYKIARSRFSCFLLSAMGGGHLETAAPAGHGALWIKTEGHPLSHLLQKPNLGPLCIVVTLITFRVQGRSLFHLLWIRFLVHYCVMYLNDNKSNKPNVRCQSAVTASVAFTQGEEFGLVAGSGFWFLLLQAATSCIIHLIHWQQRKITLEENGLHVLTDFWKICLILPKYYIQLTRSAWHRGATPQGKKTALFKLDIIRVSELLMDVIVGETSHNTEQAVHMLSQVSDSRLWRSFKWVIRHFVAI